MNKKVLVGILLLVIFASIASMLRGRRTPTKTDKIIVQGLAEVAAEEVAKAVGAPATILIIEGQSSGLYTVSPEVARFPQQFAGLLEKQGEIKIIGTEKLPMYGADLSDLPKGAPVPSTARTQVPVLPWDAYAAATKKYPGVDAVVTMLGPPRVTAADRTLWTAQKTKLIAVLVTGEPENARVALQQGVLDLAILPRGKGEPVKGDGPKSPRAWFASLQYQILTPETVAQMK